MQSLHHTHGILKTEGPCCLEIFLGFFTRGPLQALAEFTLSNQPACTVGRSRIQTGYSQKHPPLTSRTLHMIFYSKAAFFTLQHTPTLSISAGQLRASQQPHFHLLHCLLAPVSPSSLKPAGQSSPPHYRQKYRQVLRGLLISKRQLHFSH